ncbi:MAG: hypothetical protein PHG73_04730 [Pygmaiobacter sp.]|nr:hypothetical protein [Pygmaiobacter sp.]
MNDWDGGFGNKPVTKESIAKVHMPESELLDEAQRARMEGEIKALLRAAQKVPVGNVVGRCYTMDGTPASDVVQGAKPGQVRLPDLDVPYIGAHNHASGLSFSEDDIREFIARQNMKWLIAVGNNGKVYMMEKIARYDEARIKKLEYKLSLGIEAATMKTEIMQLLMNFYKEARDYGLFYYS